MTAMALKKKNNMKKGPFKLKSGNKPSPTKFFGKLMSAGRKIAKDIGLNKMTMDDTRARRASMAARAKSAIGSNLSRRAMQAARAPRKSNFANTAIGALSGRLSSPKNRLGVTRRASANLGRNITRPNKLSRTKNLFSFGSRFF